MDYAKRHENAMLKVWSGAGRLTGQAHCEQLLLAPSPQPRYNIPRKVNNPPTKFPARSGDNFSGHLLAHLWRCGAGLF